MKSLCFVTTDISEMGGLQRVTSVLVNELSKDPALDVSILFTSPKNKSENNYYFLEESVNVYSSDEFHNQKLDFAAQKILRKVHANLFEFKNIKFLKEIYFPKREIEKFNSFFKENPKDIIIGITPKYAALITLINDDSKKIGWLHNTYNRYFNFQGKEYWNQEALYNHLLKKLDELVVLSNFDKKDYGCKFNLQPTRIYNPLSFMSEQKSGLKPISLLFVGRIYYKTKGIDLLLMVMNQVVKVNPDIVLNIVGDGPDKDRMLDEIKLLGLSKNITYHGSTSNVEEHYLANSILLLPSTIEGFGLVVTEAMEYGLPVISFSTEGPSEIIGNGINGFLIPKYDTYEFSKKIIYLINNPIKLKSMGKNATKRAKDFSVEKIVNQWEKLINN